MLFARLDEEEEAGPGNVEIPESGANSECRHINMANVLVGNDWGRKNWEKECSSISDAGFNGGGLCSSPCINMYVEYLGSFYPEGNI